jgi:hypothetical protein
MATRTTAQARTSDETTVTAVTACSACTAR